LKYSGDGEVPRSVLRVSGNALERIDSTRHRAFFGHTSSLWTGLQLWCSEYTTDGPGRDGEQ
jgi:hypothetical protein